MCDVRMKALSYNFFKLQAFLFSYFVFAHFGRHVRITLKRERGEGGGDGRERGRQPQIATWADSVVVTGL